MLRQARLDVPGALHHIMVRGINKADILKDQQDKTKFRERLGEKVAAGKCSVYTGKTHTGATFSRMPPG